MIPKKLLRFPVYREDWKELIKLPCDLLRRFSLIKLYQRYTEADKELAGMYAHCVEHLEQQITHSILSGFRGKLELLIVERK